MTGRRRMRSLAAAAHPQIGTRNPRTHGPGADCCGSQSRRREMSAEVVTRPALAAEDRRRWLALAVIVTAQFMVVLDIAIVNVALPSIKTDLHFTQESLQWVITAYSIFFGGFLLLGGRLADLLGRRRLFMGGLLLFTVSSL